MSVLFKILLERYFILKNLELLYGIFVSTFKTRANTKLNEEHQRVFPKQCEVCFFYMSDGKMLMKTPWLYFFYSYIVKLTTYKIQEGKISFSEEEIGRSSAR